MQKLERTTFEVSRELEYLSEKELTQQIGHGQDWWPAALLKELMDNALDACESAGVPPVVHVAVQDDWLSIGDNGPGIPAKTVRGSIDYLKRVSDKLYYVSPTRGQLGNALKTVYAAPFVVDGEAGRVEVWAQGMHHTIDVGLDRIQQKPAISHSEEPDGSCKNGTILKVHWRDVACFLDGGEAYGSYRPPTAREIVVAYAACNPHATFHLNGTVFDPTVPEWSKWRPCQPTSPHWYTPESLRDLVVDLGLRLQDIGGLETEDVVYREWDPATNLAANGATEHEIAVLVGEPDYSGNWHGRRVELNAMTSPHFVAWLEQKLGEHGVTKVVPEHKALAGAYEAVIRGLLLEDAVAELQQKLQPMIDELNAEIWDALREVSTDELPVAVPDDMGERVAAWLTEHRTATWDRAVESIATSDYRQQQADRD